MSNKIKKILSRGKNIFMDLYPSKGILADVKPYSIRNKLIVDEFIYNCEVSLKEHGYIPKVFKEEIVDAFDLIAQDAKHLFYTEAPLIKYMMEQLETRTSLKKAFSDVFDYINREILESYTRIENYEDFINLKKGKGKYCKQEASSLK